MTCFLLVQDAYWLLWEPRFSHKAGGHKEKTKDSQHTMVRSGEELGGFPLTLGEDAQRDVHIASCLGPAE